MAHISKEIPDTIIFEDSEIGPTAFHTGSDVYAYTSQCNEYEGRISEINTEKNHIVIQLDVNCKEPLYATIPINHIIEMF